MYRSVLFICTGNICRSPTADGMLREKLKEAGLDHITVDSAGIHAFHEGSPPDIRAVQEAKNRGYDIGGLVSRPIRPKDFFDFDLIIAMDEGHLHSLRMMKPDDSEATLKLHSNFAKDPVWENVPDPYYGGPEHFTMAFDLIENGVDGILKVLKDA